MQMSLVAMAIALAACSEGKKPNASEAERNEAYRMPDDLLASKQDLKLSELAPYGMFHWKRHLHASLLRSSTISVIRTIPFISWMIIPKRCMSFPTRGSS